MALNLEPDNVGVVVFGVTFIFLVPWIRIRSGGGAGLLFLFGRKLL